ncbi:hypothetical protein FOXB_08224 [Fusarium oxysporum f. sp. conglutinans Fo5176]|uniref:Uncharacterized protein n=1 Tax=Fusarium oxysporum (strain Fo5176) TaxID=660025 RepID=F9FP94_FUSOF|nr:hypothetical protein FOXB_08224 [Fusarium oxysporum f. sp. conglutinans Fo5176]
MVKAIWHYYNICLPLTHIAAAVGWV